MVSSDDPLMMLRGQPVDWQPLIENSCPKTSLIKQMQYFMLDSEL